MNPNSFRRAIVILPLAAVIVVLAAPDAVQAQAEDPSADWTPLCKSIRDFGVLPANDAEVNRANLQKAINWAAPRGAAL